MLLCTHSDRIVELLGAKEIFYSSVANGCTNVVTICSVHELLTRCPSRAARWCAAWSRESGPVRGDPGSAADAGQWAHSSHGGACGTDPPCVSVDKAYESLPHLLPHQLSVSLCKYFYRAQHWENNKTSKSVSSMTSQTLITPELQYCKRLKLRGFVN